MGVRIKGGPGVRANFTLLKLQMEGLQKQWLELIGEYVKKEAQKRAPIDTRDMEQAIVSRRTSQKTMAVFVDSSLIDLEEHDGYDYSIAIHEGQGVTWHKLGPRSLIKQSIYPEIEVGGKFLERATEENREFIKAQAAAMFKELAKR